MRCHNHVAAPARSLQRYCVFNRVLPKHNSPGEYQLWPTNKLKPGWRPKPRYSSLVTSSVLELGRPARAFQGSTLETVWLLGPSCPAGLVRCVFQDEATSAAEARLSDFNFQVASRNWRCCPKSPW